MEKINIHKDCGDFSGVLTIEFRLKKPSFFCVLNIQFREIQNFQEISG